MYKPPKYHQWHAGSSLNTENSPEPGLSPKCNYGFYILGYKIHLYYLENFYIHNAKFFLQLLVLQWPSTKCLCSCEGSEGDVGVSQRWGKKFETHVHITVHCVHIDKEHLIVEKVTYFRVKPGFNSQLYHLLLKGF